MNIDEAKAVLHSELNRYRSRTYADLRKRLGSQDDFVAVAPSGTEYAIEVDFFWDRGRNGDIRVMGMIDDGSTRYTRRPLTDSFILGPDGRFVGENPA